MLPLISPVIRHAVNPIAVDSCGVVFYLVGYCSFLQEQDISKK